MKKLLILTLAVFAFAACSQEGSKNPASDGQAKAEVADASYTLPAVYGGEAFVFNKKNASKPAIIASMAGFCGYCKMMLPHMDQLASQYKDKNVDILVAFVDGSADSVKDLEPVKNATNIKIHYNGGKFAEDNGVTGFPTMFFFNNKTGEVKKWVGADPAYIAEMSQAIDSAL